MRFIFGFVLLFLCCAAWGATMCMPDLSSCESCTDFEDTGELFWSANCCGVPVSGVWLQNNNWGETRSVDVTEVFSFEVFGSVGAMGRQYCFMLSPFIAPYGVQVEYAIVSNAGVCKDFIPRCALTKCTDRIENTGGSGFDW